MADYFIDLGEIADRVRKEGHGPRYDERDLHEQQPMQYLHEQIPVPEGAPDGFQTAMRVVVETSIEEVEEFDSTTEFIRVTDEH